MIRKLKLNKKAVDHNNLSFIGYNLNHEIGKPSLTNFALNLRTFSLDI